LGCGVDTGLPYYPLAETGQWRYQSEGKDATSVRVTGVEDIGGQTYYRVVATDESASESVSFQRTGPEGVMIRFGTEEPENLYYPLNVEVAGTQWETMGVGAMPLTCKSAGPVEGGLVVLDAQYPDVVRVDCSPSLGGMNMTVVQYLARGVGTVRTVLSAQMFIFTKKKVYDLVPR